MATEETIILERVGMTLSVSEGHVVYSPKEGVQAAHYPKFIFDVSEFEQKVGKPLDNPSLEGCQVTFVALTTEHSNSKSEDPYVPQPQGGVQTTKTICSICGVQLAKVKGKGKC